MLEFALFFEILASLVEKFTLDNETLLFAINLLGMLLSIAALLCSTFIQDSLRFKHISKYFIFFAVALGLVFILLDLCVGEIFYSIIWLLLTLLVIICAIVNNFDL